LNILLGRKFLKLLRMHALISVALIYVAISSIVVLLLRD